MLWVLADAVNPPLFLVKVCALASLQAVRLTHRFRAQQRHLVERVVVLLACGVEHEHLEVMASTKRLFANWALLQAPGDKTRIFHAEAAFIQCAISPEERSKRAQQSGRADGEGPTLSRTELVNALMPSVETMRANKYLLHEDRDAPDAAYPTLGFVRAGPTAPVSGPPHLLAIDCEMVWTASGLTLARLSVVNEARELLYDTFVQPSEPITDYNTRFSGITPALLDGVTTTLEDAREKLMSFFQPETVLVGHSLENDLRTLKVRAPSLSLLAVFAGAHAAVRQLFHGRVIDTALLFHHSRGPPFKPSLRWLAEKHLGQSIQTSEAGHDSIEDARTAMSLVLLKLEKGAHTRPE